MLLRLIFFQEGFHPLFEVWVGVLSGVGILFWGLRGKTKAKKPLSEFHSRSQVGGLPTHVPLSSITFVYPFPRIS